MKIRVLVVDDDPMQLKLLTTFLTKLNLTSTTAKNGIEAVERMREDRYDIILMDIQMPQMDGAEATRIIRNEISKDVPIIAVTAINNFTFKKCIELGMNDYLPKPVNAEMLNEVIAKHCPRID